MSSQEGAFSIKPPLFNGSNFVFYRHLELMYGQSLKMDINIQPPFPQDTARKKQYETNAKIVNTILGSLANSKFMKVMSLNNAKAMWDKAYPKL